jgi:hypothetical protein
MFTFYFLFSHCQHTAIVNRVTVYQSAYAVCIAIGLSLCKVFSVSCILLSAPCADLLWGLPSLQSSG